MGVLSCSVYYSPGLISHTQCSLPYSARLLSMAWLLVLCRQLPGQWRQSWLDQDCVHLCECTCAHVCTCVCTHAGRAAVGQLQSALPWGAGMRTFLVLWNCPAGLRGLHSPAGRLRTEQR